MSGLFWSNDDQMARSMPCLSMPQGKPRVDDRPGVFDADFIDAEGSLAFGHNDAFSSQSLVPSDNDLIRT